MRGSSHGKSTSMHSRERPSLRLCPDSYYTKISSQNDHVKTPFHSQHAPTTIRARRCGHALNRTQPSQELPTSYTKSRTCTHTCSRQTVYEAANPACLAGEAASPARAGQIEGQDLLPGISAVESQLIFWTASLSCGWRLAWWRRDRNLACCSWKKATRSEPLRMRPEPLPAGLASASQTDIVGAVAEARLLAACIHHRCPAHLTPVLEAKHTRPRTRLKPLTTSTIPPNALSVSVPG